MRLACRHLLCSSNLLTTHTPPFASVSPLQVVPLAYQVMSVLMNYKRTVEDFGKCGTKAGNPYNFPFVSDCARSRDYSHPSPKCEDPKQPVACSDGHCRSDYISCLKAIVKMEEKRGSPDEVKIHEQQRHKSMEAKLLHDGVFAFDKSGVVEPKEDEEKASKTTK